MGKHKESDDTKTPKSKTPRVHMPAKSEEQLHAPIKCMKSLEAKQRMAQSISVGEFHSTNVAPMASLPHKKATIQRRATTANTGGTVSFALDNDKTSTPTAPAPKKRRRWSLNHIFKFKTSSSSSSAKHAELPLDALTRGTITAKSEANLDGSDPLALTYQLHNSKKKYVAQTHTDTTGSNSKGVALRARSSGNLSTDNTRPLSTVGPLKGPSKPSATDTNRASFPGLKPSVDSLEYDKNWLVATPNEGSEDSFAPKNICQRRSSLRLHNRKPKNEVRAHGRTASASAGQLKSCLKTPTSGRQTMVTGLVSPRLPKSRAVSPRHVSQVSSMSSASTSVFSKRSGSFKRAPSLPGQTHTQATTPHVPSASRTHFPFDNRAENGRRHSTRSSNGRLRQETNQSLLGPETDADAVGKRRASLIPYFESAYSRTNTPELAYGRSRAATPEFTSDLPEGRVSPATFYDTPIEAHTQDLLSPRAGISPGITHTNPTATATPNMSATSPDSRVRPRHNSQPPQLNVRLSVADVPCGSPASVTYIGRGAGHGRPYSRSVSLEPHLSIGSPYPAPVQQQPTSVSYTNTPRCQSGPPTPSELLIPTQLYQYPTYTRPDSSGPKSRRGSAPSPARQIGSSLQQRARSFRKSISINTQAVKQTMAGRGKSTSLSSTPEMTRGFADAWTEMGASEAEHNGKSVETLGRRRAISFSSKAVVTPTFSKGAYDRTGCVTVAGGLTKEELVDIYTDLMNYKLSEMEVHEESVMNTNTNMTNITQIDADERTEILDAIVERHLKAEREELAQMSEHPNYLAEESGDEADKEIVLCTASFQPTGLVNTDSGYHTDSQFPDEPPGAPTVGTFEAIFGRMTHSDEFLKASQENIMQQVLMESPPPPEEAHSTAPGSTFFTPEYIRTPTFPSFTPEETYRNAPMFSDSSVAALQKSREKMLGQLERSDTKTLLSIEGSGKSGGVRRGLRMIGPKLG